MISFRKGTLRKLCSGGDASIVQRLILNQDGYWLEENSERIDEPIEKWVYVFNGTDSYVDTNQVAVSLEGRFKVDAKITSSGCLISNRTSGNNYFEVDAGNVGQPLVTVDLKESPTHYTLVSNFINDGDWHNIEIVYTGTELTILIDGLPDSTLTGITPLSSNNNNVLIGTNNSNGHVLSGMLSNFKWMNLNEDILLQYNMEEQAGDIAYDASGKRIHGTHYGGLTHTTVIEPLYNHVNKEGYSNETYFDGNSYFVTTDSFDFLKQWSIELNVQRLNDTVVHVVTSENNEIYEPIVLTPEGFIIINVGDVNYQTKRLLHYNKEEVVRIVHDNNQVSVYVNNVLEDVFDTALYLNEIAVPTAGFSLRRLDANYTGDILEVRRSFDNNTIPIGLVGDNLDTVTLEAFCNPNTVVYTSDFTSGNEDLNEANGIATDGETIAGVSDCYKFELTNGSNIHQILKSGFDNDQSMTVTFDYYIPSTNVELNALFPGFVGGTSQLQPSITDTWTSVTLQITDSNNGVFFIRGWSNSGQVFSADGDVFYLKNIVITQLTTDGFVTTWYDQSGNGNNAVQLTASAQPKIVSAGSVILENGKPAIYYDGVDDVLETSPISILEASLFSVLNIDANTYNNSYGGIFSAASSRGFIYHFAHGYNFRTNNYNKLVDETLLPVGQHLITQIVDATTGSGWGNGLNGEQNVTLTSNPGYNLFRIGGQAFTVGIKGSIQEIILYDTDQKVKRKNIESNINRYFNIGSIANSPLIVGSNSLLEDGYRGYLKDVVIYNDGELFYDSNLNQTINGLGTAVTGTNVHFKKLPRVFDCIAVQDYPWAWITQQHYIIYKGNYFQPSFDGTVLIGDTVDYDAITTINLSNTGIDTTINATMINKFQNLTHLLLFNTNVYLDLAGITSPISVLRISNTGANVIDVSSLTSMLMLQANDNYIYQLDISNNDINYLYLDNNALSSIDLANNTLTDLEISNNELTQIITSGAPYATNNLILNNNQLTNIDLTAFPVAFEIQIENNLINAVNSSNLIIDLDNNATTNSISNGYLEGEINGAGYLSPLSLTSYYNLTDPLNTTSGNWTIVGYVYQLFPGIDYNVEDFPYTWITTPYYNTYTGNTFQVSVVTNMPHSTLYDAVTLIYLANSSLTTDITATFLSNYTALTQLFVQNNSITILDLSNPMPLFMLNASNNQIASINLSNLALLGVVDLSRNPIATIDISNNPALSYLDIADANLTTIDVSNNPDLTTLITFNNNITNTAHNQILLDLYNNNLSNTLGGVFDTTVFGGGYISPHAVYYANQLINPGNWTITGIDLTLLVGFTYNVEDFPYVWIEDNYYPTYAGDVFQVSVDTPMPDNFDYELINTISLASLSLTTSFTETLLEKYSQLKIITIGLNNIPVFEPYVCPLLEYVDCSENVISSLDVGALAALTDLIAYKNALTSINIANNPLLEVLFIQQNSLTTIDLSTAPALQQLTIYENDLTELDVTNNPLLTLVNSRDNEMDRFANSQLLIDIDTTNTATPGTINSNIFTTTNEQLTLLGVEAFRSLITAGWTIIGLSDQLLTLQDYNVEEFPLVWINDLYYQTYTANTFQVSAQTPMPVSADYVGITTIDLNTASLTTDFTDELLSKYVSLDRLYLNNNNISIVDLQSCVLLTSLLVNDNANLSALDITNCTLLQIVDANNCDLSDLVVTYSPQVSTLRCANNNLNAAVNSQLLIDLDGHGLLNGTFETTVVPATEYVSPSAIDAFNSLKVVKGWNIIGIDGILYTGTYDVEDFPLVWLDAINNYYQTYTGNTFTTTADVPMPGQSDYDLITTIQVLNGGLTTNFTNTLLSKYKNLISLNLGGNSVGIVELQDNLALNNLTLSNNNLLSIDLSNNELLTTVNLNGNALMTSIVLNGVYNQLTTFRASTNLITSIDLLNMPALTFLDLQSTDITSLDISNNTQLQTLYLTSCLLDTIANGDIIVNLNQFGLTGGTFNTTNVTDDPFLLDVFDNYYNLVNTLGWTVVFINQFEPFKLNGGQTYNVEDFPLDWYNTFIASNDDNTFTPGADYPLQYTISVYNAVTTLDFSGLQLTTDFTDTMLSKFPSLEILILNVNQFTVLELQSLTDLISLEIRTASQFSALDISNNINLETLYTHNHDISTLNISNNPNLERIWCYYSLLDTIIAVGTYPIEEIRVHGNQLSSLYLSHYPVLINLRCHLNQLTTLDISGNPLIDLLQCHDNQFDVAAVEQIISDLLSHGVLNGYLEISIDTGGVLTPAGYQDLVALVNNGWTIVGL